MPNEIGGRVKVRSTFLMSSQFPVMPESELVFHQGHNGLLLNIFMLVVKLGTLIIALHHLHEYKTYKL